MTYERRFSERKITEFLEKIDNNLRGVLEGYFKDSLFNKVNREINHVQDKAIIEVEYALPETGNVYAIKKEFSLEDCDDDYENSQHPNTNILDENTSCLYVANIPWKKTLFTNKIHPTLQDIVDSFEDKYSLSTHKHISSLPCGLNVPKYSSHGPKSKYLLAQITKDFDDKSEMAFLENFLVPLEQKQKSLKYK